MKYSLAGPPQWLGSCSWLWDGEVLRTRAHNLVKNTWPKQREIAGLQVEAADAAEVVAGAKVAAAVIRVAEARDKTEAREGGWVYPGNGNDHRRHRLPATQLLDYKMLKRLLKVLKLLKLMKENRSKTGWSLEANKNQLRLRNLAKQHREEEMAALQANGMLNKQGELALGGKYDDVSRVDKGPSGAVQKINTFKSEKFSIIKKKNPHKFKILLFSKFDNLKFMFEQQRSR